MSYEYVKYKYLKVHLTDLKIKISLKTNERTQIMFLPKILIIVQFTLISNIKTNTTL